MESNEKERLRKLDKIRKDRHYKKKRKEWEESTIFIDCACGCGTKIKPIDPYGRPKTYEVGHNTTVKYDDPLEHKRVYGRKRYINPVLKERVKKQKNKYSHAKKVKLIAEKGGCCTKCGLKYDGENGCVFQFHHRIPEEKEDRVLFWWSWERIVKEAIKTDLVCANCHFKIHSEKY